MNIPRQLDEDAISNDDVIVNSDAVKDLALLGGIGALFYAIFTSQKQAQQASLLQASVVPGHQPQGEALYMPLVQEAASNAGIPASVLAAVVNQESTWSNAPNRSSAGCGIKCIASSDGYCTIGLAQLMKTTAASVGVTGDLCDPATNLLAAATYLRRLYDKFGDWRLATAAYNWGPGNVQQVVEGKKALYTKYANAVLATASNYQASGLAGTPHVMGFVSRPASVSMFRLRS